MYDSAYKGTTFLVEFQVNGYKFFRFKALFCIWVLLFGEYCLYLPHITDNNNLKQSDNEKNVCMDDGRHPYLRRNNS